VGESKTVRRESERVPVSSHASTSMVLSNRSENQRSSATTKAASRLGEYVSACTWFRVVGLRFMVQDLGFTV